MIRALLTPPPAQASPSTAPTGSPPKGSPVGFGSLFDALTAPASTPLAGLGKPPEGLGQPDAPGVELLNGIIPGLPGVPAGVQKFPPLAAIAAPEVPVPVVVPQAAVSTLPINHARPLVLEIPTVSGGAATSEIGAQAGTGPLAGAPVTGDASTEQDPELNLDSAVPLTVEPQPVLNPTVTAPTAPAGSTQDTGQAAAPQAQPTSNPGVPDPGVSTQPVVIRQEGTISSGGVRQNAPASPEGTHGPTVMLAEGLPGAPVATEAQELDQLPASGSTGAPSEPVTSLLAGPATPPAPGVPPVAAGLQEPGVQAVPTTAASQAAAPTTAATEEIASDAMAPAALDLEAPAAPLLDTKPVAAPVKELRLAPEPQVTRIVQEQLRGPIARMVSDVNGNTLIKVRLHPEELGPVTVKATFHSTGVRIELIPVTEAARDAVKATLPDLRRDLLAHGSDASLSMGDESSPGESRRGPRQEQAPRYTAPTELPAPPTVHAPPVETEHGRLDRSV